MPDPAELDFRGHVGSVAIDTGGGFIVATSPRCSVAGLKMLERSHAAAGFEHHLLRL